MSKHTPGPWKAIFTTAVNKRDSVKISCPVGGYSVAETLQLPGCDYNTEKANAHLIAAAPELLKALRECHTDEGALGYSRPGAPGYYHEARFDRINEIVKAAITKTVG